MVEYITHAQSRLLFNALIGNGVFSSLCGLVMMFQAYNVAAWIGLPYPQWLSGIGFMLVLFGARLIWLGRRKSILRIEALLISAMDLGWIIITIGLAAGLPGLFNPAGVYVVFTVAFAVLVFLDMQVYALWKCRC